MVPVDVIVPLFEWHGGGGGDEKAGDQGERELHGGDGVLFWREETYRRWSRRYIPIVVAFWLRRPSASRKRLEKRDSMPKLVWTLQEMNIGNLSEVPRWRRRPHIPFLELHGHNRHMTA